MDCVKQVTKSKCGITIPLEEIVKRTIASIALRATPFLQHHHWGHALNNRALASSVAINKQDGAKNYSAQVCKSEYDICMKSCQRK